MVKPLLEIAFSDLRAAPYLACCISQSPFRKRNRQSISKQTLDQSPRLLCYVKKWKSSLWNGFGRLFKCRV